MAKIAFTKLGLKTNQEVKTIQFNDQVIEVKQYLPVNEKLELISHVINSSVGENNNFANPIKVDIFTALQIIDYYTNINFTEKQKEDPAKLYDLLASSGLMVEVYNAIPVEEYEELIDGVARSIGAFYNYRNSVLGILDSVSADYSNLSFDINALQQQLGDPENMNLLRSVLAKLG